MQHSGFVGEYEIAGLEICVAISGHQFIRVVNRAISTPEEPTWNAWSGPGSQHPSRLRA